MHRSVSILPVLFFILIFSSLQAQLYPFQKLTVYDGLPSNGVFTMDLDSIGRLWLGTENGLSVYDGYGFKTYNMENGLPESLVLALEIDRFGRVNFSCGRSGFYYLSGDSLHHIENMANNYFISKIYEDREGYLWLSNFEKVLKLSADSSRQLLDSFDIPGVLDLLEDSQGNVWASSFKKGVVKIANKEKAEVAFGGIDGNVVFYSVFEDSQKQLWFGYYDGLLRYDGQTFQPFKLQRPNSSVRPYAFLEMPDSSMLIATLGAGILRWKNDAVVHKIEHQNGLPDEYLYDMIRDREGSIWLASYKKGIAKLNSFNTLHNYESNYPAGAVQTMALDSEDHLWLGVLDEGVYRADRPDEIYSDKYTDIDLPNNQINVLLSHPEWGMVAGTTDGVGIIYKDGSMESLFEGAPGVDDHILSLHYDEVSKDLLIGGYGSLLYRVDSTKKVHRIPLPGDRAHVLGIFQAGVKKYLLVSAFSISFIENDSLLPIPEIYYKPKDLWAVTKDKHNNLWLVDNRHLVWIEVDTNQTLTGKHKKFNLAEYFNEYQVSDLEIKDSTLWLVTQTEIFSIPLGRFYSRGEIQPRRLPIHAERSGGFDFVFYSILPNKDHIYIGTENGLFAFEEAKQIRQPKAPVIRMNDIRLFSQKTSLQPYLVKDKDTGTEQLQLPYYQNHITFTFSAISISQPEAIQYEYILEGFENKWSELTTERSVTYAFLPPGDYTFKVKAYHSYDNIWSATPLQYHFNIKWPFWQKWWFVSLAIFFVTGGLALFIMQRIRHIKSAQDKQTIITRQVLDAQEKERARLAQEFHDGVNQNLVFLKTRLHNMAIDPETIHIVQESIEEIRRISKNLHPPQLERLGLSKALMAMAGEFATTSNIQFDYYVEPVEQFMEKEQEIHFFRFIQEGLTNIYKHSQANKAILHVFEEGHSIIVKIEDDGRGFRVEEKIDGHSLGLKTIQERIKYLNGTLEWTSQPGKTILFVKIPKSKMYVKRKESLNS